MIQKSKKAKGRKEQKRETKGDRAFLYHELDRKMSKKKVDKKIQKI